MQVKKTIKSPTSVNLKFTLNEADLSPYRQQVVRQLGSNVKLAGFRAGKAPAHLIEKSIDQEKLQNDVIEQSVNHFYIEGLQQNRLRPVSRPEVEIKKFVPFTLLEFDANVDVMGDIKLADYKKIKLAKPTVVVEAKDINEVVAQLQTRLAEKTEVKRPAKNGDEVIINFKGVDAKGKPVNGAEGKDYPLVLGSDAFIPGFETNLLGMKTGENKEFNIVFPKDYSVGALAGSKVTFTVEVTKVQELKQPKADDEFAAKAGPFKTLKDLKADIKTQLTQERQNEAARKYESDLVEKITSKSSLVVPPSLIEDQLDSAEREERQNLMYRGQTWEEHLKAEGVTEEQHRQRNRPQAEARVKAGLVLSQISEEEKLDVTPEELDLRIQLLKGQYTDAAMQAELDKPENRRDVAARILTEKTISNLVKYANS